MTFSDESEDFQDKFTTFQEKFAGFQDEFKGFKDEFKGFKDDFTLPCGEFRNSHYKSTGLHYHTYSEDDTKQNQPQKNKHQMHRKVREPSRMRGAIGSALIGATFFHQCLSRFIGKKKVEADTH